MFKKKKKRLILLSNNDHLLKSVWSAFKDCLNLGQINSTDAAVISSKKFSGSLSNNVFFKLKKIGESIRLFK